MLSLKLWNLCAFLIATLAIDTFFYIKFAKILLNKVRRICQDDFPDSFLKILNHTVKILTAVSLPMLIVFAAQSISNISKSCLASLVGRCI